MSERRRYFFGDPERVKSVDVCGDYASIDLGGSGFGWPMKLAPPPEVGQLVQAEVCNGSTITGAKVDGEWAFRKTDYQLDAEHAEMVEGFRLKERERLESCRSAWIGHEEHLPNWAQRRLARFREAGGEQFELQGWGYELAICRLAVAYIDEGVPAPDDYTSTPEVKRLDEEMGCSGNQHGCAKVLARLVLDGREDDAAGGVPAGLAPLTGSADYAQAP